MVIEVPENGRPQQGRSLHFLEELEHHVEAAEKRLEEALHRRYSVELFHDRMVAKIRADGLPKDLERRQLARIEGQRRQLIDGLGLERLERVLAGAVKREQLAFEAYMTANEYSMESVISINLRRLLLADRHPARPAAGERRAISGLARALKEYLWSFPSDEADRRIRHYWTLLEQQVAASA